jgi:hypothetical protein
VESIKVHNAMALPITRCLDNILKEILKLFAGATINNFQIDMAFKKEKLMS